MEWPRPIAHEHPATEMVPVIPIELLAAYAVLDVVAWAWAVIALRR